MVQGISKNPLTDISKVYLEQVSIDERLGGKGYKRRKDYAGRTVEGDWPDSDRGGGHKAKKRAGGKVEKKSPTYQAYVLNKESVECDCDCGEVPCVKCGEDHHKVSEGFSNWRDELREIVTDASAMEDDENPEIKEKKVKNKIKINPEFKEAVEEIGGQLLEVQEVSLSPDEETDGQPIGASASDNKAEKSKKKETMLKKRIIRMKMMAVNSGSDEGIVASYQPEIEGAVQYFYEQGINEEGLDQIIEEIGLDEFVDFVLSASQFLN